MTVLDRAKALQLKVTTETSFWVKLDLFEAMVAEIERLQAYERAHPQTAANSVAEVYQRQKGSAAQ
jgi:hypothetical protein